MLLLLLSVGEDIQDLTVMSQPPPAQTKFSVPDDPAIISAVRLHCPRQQLLGNQQPPCQHAAVIWARSAFSA